MLYVRDPGAVPGEGWIYFVAATNWTVRAPNYFLLYREVVKHCAANNVPAPTEQQVIDYVCENLHANCADSETRQPFVNKLSLSLPIPAAGCCGK